MGIIDHHLQFIYCSVRNSKNSHLFFSWNVNCARLLLCVHTAFCLYVLYGADVWGDYSLGNYKSIPYTLNNSMPQPLLHPETANNILKENNGQCLRQL